MKVPDARFFAAIAGLFVIIVCHFHNKGVLSSKYILLSLLVVSVPISMLQELPRVRRGSIALRMLLACSPVFTMGAGWYLLIVPVVYVLFCLLVYSPTRSVPEGVKMN